MFRHILCPVDFSPPSQSALRLGAELARTLGADLVLLHVVQTSPYPTSYFAALDSFPTLHEELRQRADAALATALASLPAGQRARTAVAEGMPFEQILAAAKDCDLIVMGTHGHSALKHALLGSTAERVVRQSPIPVLTVH
jgi:nucleotide-binding universal stress UspA family protein